MRFRLPVLLCLLPIVALAETFDDRVRIAEEIESEEAHKPYIKEVYSAVGPHMGSTMRHCFETVNDPKTDTFYLVASISNKGRPRRVEVRPSTNIARCFAKGIEEADFPQPPALPDHDGFPIVIEMRIE